MVEVRGNRRERKREGGIKREGVEYEVWGGATGMEAMEKEGKVRRRKSK